MDYASIENDIVAKLVSATEVTAIADVMALPDYVEDFKIPQKKGVVTVVFVGEKYDRNQSVGEVSQQYTLTFNVAIQARLLRGSSGIYTISQLVKSLLLGFAPKDCGALVLNEHAMAALHEKTQVWEHHVTFSCQSLRVSENLNLFPDNDITDGEEVFYDPSKLTVNNCNS